MSKFFFAFFGLLFSSGLAYAATKGNAVVPVKKEGSAQLANKSPTSSVSQSNQSLFFWGVCDHFGENSILKKMYLGKIVQFISQETALRIVTIYPNGDRSSQEYRPKSGSLFEFKDVLSGDSESIALFKKAPTPESLTQDLVWLTKKKLGVEGASLETETTLSRNSFNEMRTLIAGPDAKTTTTNCSLGSVSEKIFAMSPVANSVYFKGKIKIQQEKANPAAQVEDVFLKIENDFSFDTLEVYFRSQSHAGKLRIEPFVPTEGSDSSVTHVLTEIPESLTGLLQGEKRGLKLFLTKPKPVSGTNSVEQYMSMTGVYQMKDALKESPSLVGVLEVAAKKISFRLIRRQNESERPYAILIDGELLSGLGTSMAVDQFAELDLEQDWDAKSGLRKYYLGSRTYRDLKAATKSDSFVLIQRSIDPQKKKLVEILVDSRLGKIRRQYTVSNKAGAIVASTSREMFVAGNLSSSYSWESQLVSSTGLASETGKIDSSNNLELDISNWSQDKKIEHSNESVRATEISQGEFFNLLGGLKSAELSTYEGQLESKSSDGKTTLSPAMIRISSRLDLGLTELQIFSKDHRIGLLFSRVGTFTSGYSMTLGEKVGTALFPTAAGAGSENAVVALIPTEETNRAVLRLSYSPMKFNAAIDGWIREAQGKKERFALKVDATSI